MFRIWAFILFMIVSCGIKVLSYLWLFLEVQISCIIICTMVKISFVVCLFCLFALSVRRCCCGLFFVLSVLLSVFGNMPKSYQFFDILWRGVSCFLCFGSSYILDLYLGCICAYIHLFSCSNVIICSVGQCRMAVHRSCMYFSKFDRSPILVGVFSISFLRIFYVVLNLLGLFFGIYFL